MSWQYGDDLHMTNARRTRSKKARIAQQGQQELW